MSEFDTHTDDSEAELNEQEERVPLRRRLDKLVKYVGRRVVVLLSFGPGILGVLWLLGRILKR